MEVNEIIKKYASRKIRVINFFLDGVLAMLIGLMIKMILLSVNFEYFNEISNRLIWSNNSTAFSFSIDFESYIFYFIYYFVSESFFRTTIAKLITKTKVVRQDGRRITFINGLKRSLLRLIPFEQFSFLSLHPVGIHDSLSDTRVINKFTD